LTGTDGRKETPRAPVYRAAAIGLAPVFIAQGLYVRCVTPRLPEPSGERSGVQGSGPSLGLLILGDSAAAGVGVATQAEALSGRLAAGLGESFRVCWKLTARTGMRAMDAVAELEAARPERFDVAVTSIGVNDVTHGTGEASWIDRQGRMVELLQSKFQTRHIILSSVPPMHLFPALPQPLRWYLGERAKRFNRALEAFARSRGACEFAAPDFPMEPATMAADGFHPGARAYSLWAAHAGGIIRRRLRQAAPGPSRHA
jgi:lysophospholipase L1-like esterase